MDLIGPIVHKDFLAELLDEFSGYGFDPETYQLTLITNGFAGEQISLVALFEAAGYGIAEDLPVETLFFIPDGSGKTPITRSVIQCYFTYEGYLTGITFSWESTYLLMELNARNSLDLMIFGRYIPWEVDDEIAVSETVKYAPDGGIEIEQVSCKIEGRQGLEKIQSGQRVEAEYDTDGRLKRLFGDLEVLESLCIEAQHRDQKFVTKLISSFADLELAPIITINFRFLHAFNDDLQDQLSEIQDIILFGDDDPVVFAKRVTTDTDIFAILKGMPNLRSIRFEPPIVLSEEDRQLLGNRGKSSVLSIEGVSVRPTVVPPPVDNHGYGQPGPSRNT